MRFQIKAPHLRREEERAKERQWHRYFVWFPLRLNNSTVVFLERVYRRKDWYGGWEYSLINPMETK